MMYPLRTNPLLNEKQNNGFRIAGSATEIGRI